MYNSYPKYQRMQLKIKENNHEPPKYVFTIDKMPL